MKNIENLLSVLSLVVKLDSKALNLAAEPKKYGSCWAVEPNADGSDNGRT
jgi:hypothetical protein